WKDDDGGLLADLAWIQVLLADDEMECEEECMEEESSLPDELRMEFMYKNKIMTLRGTPKATIHWVQLMNVEGQAIKDMLDPKLTKVVDTFRDVFAVPIELPPQITYDHRIPLLPNTQPVNIRPYRNPPMQKDAIEVMVKELLDSGVIKPSNSPFASPIELIEELHGATIFSKLDLRFGYHQIRMHKEDIPKSAFKTHQGHMNSWSCPLD
ncbi:hypothetical protein Tco_1120742, partial [Tanacetum coccineum]